MNLLELVGKKTYIYGTGKFTSRIKGVLEKETIIVSRPVLAISTYHAPMHHWQILNYLGGFLRNYSFYLRVHGEQTFDVILYAFPNDM